MRPREGVWAYAEEQRDRGRDTEAWGRCWPSDFQSLLQEDAPCSAGAVRAGVGEAGGWVVQERRWRFAPEGLLRAHLTWTWVSRSSEREVGMAPGIWLIQLSEVCMQR